MPTSGPRSNLEAKRGLEAVEDDVSSAVASQSRAGKQSATPENRRSRWKEPPQTAVSREADNGPGVSYASTILESVKVNTENYHGATKDPGLLTKSRSGVPTLRWPRLQKFPGFMARMRAGHRYLSGILIVVPTLSFRGFIPGFAATILSVERL